MVLACNCLSAYVTPDTSVTAVQGDMCFKERQHDSGVHLVEVKTVIEGTPVIGGVKSCHRFLVTDGNVPPIEVLEKSTGATLCIPSIRNYFMEYVQESTCEGGTDCVKVVELRGRTATGFCVVPNIDYQLTITLGGGNLLEIQGCHDRFPSYEIRVDGKPVYSHEHHGLDLLGLFGRCDVSFRR